MGRNIGINLHEFLLVNVFLNIAPKEQAAKEKYINMTSPKFKKELYIKGQYQDNKKATGRMKIMYLIRI